MGVHEALQSAQPVYAGAGPAVPAAHEGQFRRCDMICRRVRRGYYVQPEILEQVIDALAKDVRAGIPAKVLSRHADNSI